MFQPIFQKIWPHLLAVAGFLALSTIYFFPQVDGKVMVQSDITQYRAMSKEMRDYQKETGRRILWTNGMFGGMPTYQISSITDGNLLGSLDRIARLGIGRPIGRFFAAMLIFYLMMLLLGTNIWVAALSAIAFGLTTNNMVLYEAGHTSKLKAIFYLPLVVGGVILAFRKQFLLGGLLFGLGLGMSIWANHIQMTYYFVMTLAFFGVFQLIDSARKQEWTLLGKALAVLVVGGLLAAGSTASNILPTRELTEDTMRGAPILEKEQTVQVSSSSETEGLAWDYAMQWSNGVIDLVATFIPGAAGGSSGEQLDRSSKLARLTNQQVLPLYWGPLPFTSGPAYLGALIFLLFLLGAFVVKGPLKWWLVLGTFFIFLLSLGKNLESLNRLLFDYLPLFNKFRAPSSALSIVPLLMTTLGFLGLYEIAAGKVDKTKALQGLYISAGILGLTALFFWIAGPSFYEMIKPQEAAYDQRIQDAFLADRQDLMQSDALRTLALILLGGGLLWALIQKRLDSKLVFGGLAVLILFDFWTIDRRYLNEGDFEPRRTQREAFQARPVDQQILKDNDLSYRVLDLTIPTFQSAQASYFHKTIGGYNAAKLQRYEDLINRHISKGNPGVLNMLNTRYIINGQPGQERVQPNPAALGNAWFVDSLILVQTPNQEIDALTDLDPGRTAVVRETEFAGLVDPFPKNNSGSIELTDYYPDRLTYSSKNSQKGLAVFSEIWYGPDKGWKAFIDGEPAPHFRVNYALRGMMVPAGEHTIEYRFEPATYRIGKTISLLSSGLLLIGLLGMLYINREALLATPEPAPVQTKKKKASPKSKKGKKKK